MRNSTETMRGTENPRISIDKGEVEDFAKTLVETSPEVVAAFAPSHWRSASASRACQKVTVLSVADIGRNMAPMLRWWGGERGVIMLGGSDTE